MYISISSYTYTYTYRYIHIHINIYIHTSSTATTTMTHPHIHRVGGGTRNQRKSAASETSRAPPQPHNHRGGGTMTHPQGGGGGGRRCTIYTWIFQIISALKGRFFGWISAHILHTKGRSRYIHVGQTYSWYPKQPFLTVMVVSIGGWTKSLHGKWLEITKHPIKNGCLEYQQWNNSPFWWYFPGNVGGFSRATPPNFILRELTSGVIISTGGSEPSESSPDWLTLTEPNALQALRRHVEHVFGAGLREEIFVPLSRAAKEGVGKGWKGWAGKSVWRMFFWCGLIFCVLFFGGRDDFVGSELPTKFGSLLGYRSYSSHLYKVFCRRPVI